MKDRYKHSGMIIYIFINLDFNIFSKIQNWKIILSPKSQSILKLLSVFEEIQSILDNFRLLSYLVIRNHYKLQSLPHFVIFNCYTASMLLKIVYKGEAHVTKFLHDASFSDLDHFIRQAFRNVPSTYKLHYLDEDQDQISLMNDLDLMNLRESGILKTKIYMEEDEEGFQKLEPEPIRKQNQKQEMKQEQQKQSKEQIKEAIQLSDEGHCEVSTKIKQEREQIDLKEFKGVSPGLDEFDDEIFGEKVQQIKPRPQIKQLKEQEVVPQKKLEAEPVEEIKLQRKVSVHENISCDLCLKSPIVGVRYRCIKCQDFDICQECEKTVKHEHALVKITSPELDPHKIYTVYNEQQLPFQEKYLNELGLWVQNLGLEEKFESTKQKIAATTKYTFESVKNATKNIMKKFHREENKEFYVDIEDRNGGIVAPEKKEVAPLPKKVNECDRLIDNASYLSSMLGKDFSSCYEFSQKYPGLNQEEILIKYFDNPQLL